MVSGRVVVLQDYIAVLFLVPLAALIASEELQVASDCGANENSASPETLPSMGEVGAIRTTPLPRWLRSPGKPWIAAVILGLMALSHGRAQSIQWSMKDRARAEVAGKRQDVAAKPPILMKPAKAKPGAANRSADEDARASDQALTETPEPAPSIVRPQSEPQVSSAPVKAAAIAVVVTMPVSRCGVAEAESTTGRPCLPRKQGFKDCPECPEMILIPAGDVMMGSPPQERGRSGNEGPQHKVTIAKPFAAGMFETTFDEWDACVVAGACRHTPNDQGWGKGRRPVFNVSWKDAKDYVTWLSTRTGLKYRLLTEAEWEYAARAGTTSAFATGEMITNAEANFDAGHTYGGSAKGGYPKSTVEVASFQPNAFGLYDMHGNVWEWVEDCWHMNYSAGPVDGSAWTIRCNERTRTLRGGSWIDPPRILRSAYRSRNFPTYRGATVGFRVARTLD